MASTADDRILEIIFDPEAPLGGPSVLQEAAVANGDSQEETPLIKEVQELEVKAIQAADREELDEALQLLNLAVAKAPSYASAYNNRAQVYQLRHQVEEALSDVNTAIELSGGRGKAARQAYTQRAIIWRVKGEDEKALEDFKVAEKLGSHFAHKQVVQMNPYSALCNEMLARAKDQLIRGESP